MYAVNHLPQLTSQSVTDADKMVSSKNLIENSRKFQNSFNKAFRSSSINSLTGEQRRSSGRPYISDEERASVQLRRLSQAYEFAADDSVPNSVVRCSVESDSQYDLTNRRSSRDNRLSKADIKQMVTKYLSEQREQIKSEDKTSISAEPQLIHENKTPKHENRINGSKTRLKSFDQEPRLSERRQSKTDKKNKLLRTVRRTSDEPVIDEIRPSLLEEIRKAIQEENSMQSDKKETDGDAEEHLFSDDDPSKSVLVSNTWLDEMTERLASSSRRVSELSERIAATRHSDDSRFSDDFNNWSSHWIIDRPLSKSEKDEPLGRSTTTRRRSGIASRDSLLRMRVGSPSVLSDKSSLSNIRSREFVRRVRSAEKTRREIKVGPAMTRQLEKEREEREEKVSSDTRMRSVRKSSSSSVRRCDSTESKRSREAVRNKSADRLLRSGVEGGSRSQSKCSVHDPKFSLAEKRCPKKASLSDLIELYYSNPLRRSTDESLQSYKEAVMKKDTNSDDISSINKRLSKNDDSAITINSTNAFSPSCYDLPANFEHLSTVTASLNTSQNSINFPETAQDDQDSSALLLTDNSVSKSFESYMSETNQLASAENDGTKTLGNTLECSQIDTGLSAPTANGKVVKKKKEAVDSKEISSRRKSFQTAKNKKRKSLGDKSKTQNAQVSNQTDISVFKSLEIYNSERGQSVSADDNVTKILENTQQKRTGTDTRGLSVPRPTLNERRNVKTNKETVDSKEIPPKRKSFQTATNKKRKSLDDKSATSKLKEDISKNSKHLSPDGAVLLENDIGETSLETSKITISKQEEKQSDEILVLLEETGKAGFNSSIDVSEKRETSIIPKRKLSTEKKRKSVSKQSKVNMNKDTSSRKESVNLKNKRDSMHHDVSGISINSANAFSPSYYDLSLNLKAEELSRVSNVSLKSNDKKVLEENTITDQNIKSKLVPESSRRSSIRKNIVTTTDRKAIRKNRVATTEGKALKSGMKSDKVSKQERRLRSGKVNS